MPDTDQEPQLHDASMGGLLESWTGWGTAESSLWARPGKTWCCQQQWGKNTQEWWGKCIMAFLD